MCGREEGVAHEGTGGSHSLFSATLLVGETSKKDSVILARHWNVAGRWSTLSRCLNV